MKFFNSNAVIGESFGPRLGVYHHAEDLLAEMDEYGIEEALVYHAMAQEYEYQFGNNKLLEELQAHDRLHGCWVGGLHYLDSAPEPDAFVKAALASNIKAVKLFFDGWMSDCSAIAGNAYDPLLGELERHRIPTFIQFENDCTISTQNLQQMTQVMDKHPALPLVFTFLRAEAKALNFLYYLMTEYRNCHLETVGIHMNGCIQKFVEGGFGQKLLFSTAYPWCNSAVTRISLAYAEIPESAKAEIAKGNLKRLIEGTVA